MCVFMQHLTKKIKKKLWLQFKVSKYNAFQITISQIGSVWVLSVQTESWSTCIWRSLKFGFSFYPEAFKVVQRKHPEWIFKEPTWRLTSSFLSLPDHRVWSLGCGGPSAPSSGIQISSQPVYVLTLATIYCLVKYVLLIKYKFDMKEIFLGKPGLMLWKCSRIDDIEVHVKTMTLKHWRGTA